MHYDSVLELGLEPDIQREREAETETETERGPEALIGLLVCISDCRTQCKNTVRVRVRRKRGRELVNKLGLATRTRA